MSARAADYRLQRGGSGNDGRGACEARESQIINDYNSGACERDGALPPSDRCCEPEQIVLSAMRWNIG